MPVPQSVQSSPQAVASTALHAVNRAIAELRRGANVLIRHETGACVVACAAEAISESQLHSHRTLLSASPVAVVSRNRAEALGVVLPADETGAVVALDLNGCTVDRIRALADPVEETMEETAAGTPPAPCRRGAVPHELDQVAIDLMKLAGLLPAAIVGVAEPAAIACAEAGAVPTIGAEEIRRYRQQQALSLRQVSAARVPLALAQDARIVAFRAGDGVAEHLAIIIGEPVPDRPVLIRLHSQCMTGDLLGSLRCDCGDQLRAAIAAIAKAGSGVLLYLAQEGRGIGLANKLRAYALQDRGADTVDANHQLGFDADERLYLSAAVMLRHLGFAEVRLLTNNPRKVSGLSACGVTVIERVPLVIESNDFNVGYLEAKARRLGHLF